MHKPPPGLLPFSVEVTPDSDGLTGRAGLPLVLDTMRAFRLNEVIQKELDLPARSSGFSVSQKVEACVLLLAVGGDCADDMKYLQADEGLCRLIGGALPGPDTTLEFLYSFHDEALIEKARAARKEGEIAYIPKENDALTALGRVNTALVHRVAARGKCTKATLDHDATIQESKNKEALPHYKGGTGYQPVAVYWAEQDLVIADEYRDGNVPAGMENLPLIQRSFAILPLTIKEYYFRADSACYDQDVLKWLCNKERKGGPKGEIGFAIGADMSDSLRNRCKELKESSWTLVEERGREKVHRAEVEFTPGDWPKSAAPLRYLVIRRSKKQGELFEGGSETKYWAVVSNRGKMKPEALLKWYHEKAGTIEGVHDVSKNELGAAVVPSKRFGANAAWYRLSLLTYNVLSAMKAIALPPHLSNARPKRLRLVLFEVAGKIINHAGRLIVKLSEAAEKWCGLVSARIKLSKVWEQTASKVTKPVASG